MPDWSYQPFFRPLLFQLPAERARDLTLGAMGLLARLPLGPSVIELMGHMRPSASLQTSVLGLTFPTPVGLGAGLDPHLLGHHALARFGFGYLELGPLTREAVVAAEAVERVEVCQAIRYPDLPINDGLDELTQALERGPALPIPIGIRLAHRPAADPDEAARERSEMIARLGRWAAFFTLETRWSEPGAVWSAAAWRAHLNAVIAAARALPNSPAVLLCLAPDLDRITLDALLAPAIECGVSGVVVAGGLRANPGTRQVGEGTHELSVRLVRQLRGQCGERLAIVGSGGVLDPADALDLFEAGADLAQIHSGLVYSGPGLAKRINEAVAHRRSLSQPSKIPPAPPKRLVPGWAWSAMLGGGLIIAGLLALAIALTRVVLPYDEQFLGLTRDEIAAINPRLLAFLTHDRVTFAGITLSLGVIYCQLALFGIRRGTHWARQIVLYSAVVGFSSFFLFLGYGYFDPFHALGTVALFVFFMLSLRAELPPQRLPRANLYSDGRWLAAQWSQLCFVTIGFGLIVGGLAIASYGVTRVFVPEDLAFMNTSAEALMAANPRLIPLIAHDRAGFGGGLVANGVAVLLIGLWGFRQGARWLWWTLLIGGVPAFAGAIGTHIQVGYLDTFHLLPAYLAVIVYVAGLYLAFPYLMTIPTPRESRAPRRASEASALGERRFEFSRPRERHENAAPPDSGAAF